jgi:O-antigen/teichoic acid export membrane protein
LWRTESPSSAVRYLSRVSLLWTAITGTFVAAVVVLADWLLPAIYGGQVTPYAWVLQWYAALQLLIFLGLPLRSLLRAAEQTRGIFLSFVAAAIFSALAAIPLLRSYGLAGVLIGLTGAQIVFQCVLTLQIWGCFQQLRQLRPAAASGEL